MAVPRVVLPALVGADRQDSGGVAVFTLELERRLRARGVEVTLVGYGPADDPSSGFTAILNPDAPRGRDFTFALWKHRNRWRFPADTVVHIQRPDEALGFLRGPWPMVVSFHGCHRRTVGMRQGKLAGLAYGVLQRKVAQRAAALAFETRRDHDAYLASHPEIAHKVHCVPNGIDRERFQPGDRLQARQELGLPTDRPVAVYLGRLVQEKNVGALIQAMRELPEAELWIVGEGDQEAVLRREAGPNVRLLGFLPNASIPVLLRAGDLLALASHHEGVATVVLQAWACGRPVVVPPVGDFPFLMRESGGLLAADNRSATLASALRTQFARLAQPGEAERQATLLREKSAEFDWETITDQLLDIYARAAADQATRV